GGPSGAARRRAAAGPGGGAAGARHPGEREPGPAAPRRPDGLLHRRAGRGPQRRGRLHRPLGAGGGGRRRVPDRDPGPPGGAGRPARRGPPRRRPGPPGPRVRPPPGGRRVGQTTLQVDGEQGEPGQAGVTVARWNSPLGPAEVAQLQGAITVISPPLSAIAVPLPISGVGRSFTVHGRSEPVACRGAHKALEPAVPAYEGASMDLELSPEQEEFRKIVRAFAGEVVAPRAGAMDRAERLDPVVLDQMAGMGLFGLPFPEEVGGMGADYTTLCLAIEELARVDSSVAITLEAAGGRAAMPIWRYGTSEQHQRWLRPLATGERLGAFGLTEPGGGSDAGALGTRAVLDGDEWVIDGTKAFITNAGLDRSGMVVLAAVTGQRPDGRNEITNIVVPA